ncbi:MAG: hypothetical protein L3K19_06720 [Thermoplasmata archaeon]|nr:hypothetical protein [Thermoplasmata archaeon]
MPLTGDPSPTQQIPPSLTPEARRWLHDKYERLAAEEGQLSSTRTTYYAAIGTVLITGLIIVLADFVNQPLVLPAFINFLAALGILISSVWAVLLHRTNDAQGLWREAAIRLEESTPPLEGEWKVPITLRSGFSIDVDLLRPYLAHQTRFSPRKGLSWMDRVNPSPLTEILPMTFLAIWGAVLVASWWWYLFFR